MGGKQIERPGGSAGGSADYELAAEAKQGSGDFDYQWRGSKAAGGHKVGMAAVLLVFAEALGSGMADDYPV